ncbi:MAG: GT4 family glycosyltransferase PelF [Halopseudomonas sp.]
MNEQHKAGQVVTDDGHADVCLVLEGTWPYVRGGVSSWINQLILGLPQVTFSVLFIGGQREYYSQRHYDVPSNVVHIEEVFLEDAWKFPPLKDQGAKPAVVQDMENLYRYFHHPDTPDELTGEAVLGSLANGQLTMQDVLRSRANWETITEGYRNHCSDPSFINYFWTMRTMQSPMVLLAETASRMPRARLLHAVSTGYAGLAGCILKRRWQCNFMLTEHGIYTKERKIDLAQASWVAENADEALNSSLDPGSGYIRSLWIRFFERMGLMVYRNADPIIALYEGNCQRQILDGADPARTRVIPNGIDLPRWNPLREHRPPGIAPVVGLIGRIVPIKDVKTFIRAMRSIVTELPETQGWIIGPEDEDGEYAADCHSLVSSMGLENSVRFLGFQRVDDILPKLGVMVLTSISEAQPLVILEAWCAGTPVVSTDVGSCRELIEGGSAEDRDLGRAGEVVAIADPQATARAVLRLLRDPEHWTAVQAAGVARANRYYGEALMLERYRQLYSSSVGSR